MKRMLSQNLILISLLLVLIGCNFRTSPQATNENPNKTVKPLMTPTPTTSFEKITAPSLLTGIKVDISATPTRINRQKLTFTPTRTAPIQPTSTIFFTPQPPLGANEAEIEVNELLKNNRNCRFPCFWGFFPGKASFSEFQNYFSRFANISEAHVFNERGSYVFDFIKNSIQIMFRISYDEDRMIINSNGSFPNDVNNYNARVFGDSKFNPLLNYFTLPQILSNYGAPNNILLKGIYDDRLSPSKAIWESSLVLDYSALGFIIEYVDFIKATGNQLLICPSQTQNFTIWLWNTEEKPSIEEVIGEYGVVVNKYNIKTFKPINEATALTLDEFYRSFTDVKNTECIDTPIDIWIQ